MACGAAEALHRVFGLWLDVQFEIRMRAKRLSALLVPRLVDDRVTSRTAINSGYFDEVYVVPEFGQDYLLDAECGSHEIEKRSIHQPGDETRLDEFQLLLEPVSRRGHFLQLGLHFFDLT